MHMLETLPLIPYLSNVVIPSPTLGTCRNFTFHGDEHAQLRY